MKNAFKIVRSYNDEQLLSLFKELKEMSNLDAPRNFKKSDLMNELFNLEKTKQNSWSDQYYNVIKVIEIELLNRCGEDDARVFIPKEPMPPKGTRQALIDFLQHMWENDFDRKGLAFDDYVDEYLKSINVT